MRLNFFKIFMRKIVFQPVNFVPKKYFLILDFKLSKIAYNSWAFDNFVDSSSIALVSAPSLTQILLYIVFEMSGFLSISKVMRVSFIFKHLQICSAPKSVNPHPFISSFLIHTSSFKTSKIISKLSSPRSGLKFKKIFMSPGMVSWFIEP